MIIQLYIFVDGGVYQLDKTVGHLYSMQREKDEAVNDKGVKNVT